MLTLYVLRHAKAKHDDASDLERRLTKHGEEAAHEMGRRLAEHGKPPKHIIASSAKRAIQTAKRVADELGIDRDEIEKEPRLYLAEADEILRYLQSRDDKAARLLIVGHNPGLTEFVNWMADAPVVPNLPTAGLVELAFDVKHWREVLPGQAKAVRVDSPKDAEP